VDCSVKYPSHSPPTYNDQFRRRRKTPKSEAFGKLFLDKIKHVLVSVLNRELTFGEAR